MSKFLRARLVTILVLIGAVIGISAIQFGGDAQAARKKLGSASPLAPSVSATMLAALQTDLTGNGLVNPGDTLRYTVTITNGAAPGAGNDASGVVFNDTLPGDLTLVGGSVTVQPVAAPDAFPVTGNVQISSANSASLNLLANDTRPQTGTNSNLTVTAIGADNSLPYSAASAQGGQVTASATDGTFSYNPPAGYEGTDSFTYTITDSTNSLTATGTVTLTISGMTWFIDQSVAAGGDGRLASPFNCLGGAGCFNAVNDGVGNHPAANDNIFMYRSAGAPAAFTNGVTLLSGQKLFGEGATAALFGAGSLTGITLATGSSTPPTTGNLPPVLTTGSITDNVRLTNGSTGNTLRGFTIGDSGTAATGDSSDISGTNFGTLGVTEVTLNGSGRTLNLIGPGTLNATFIGVSSNKSTGEGMKLDNIGGATNMGSTTISGQAIQCITVQNSTIDVNFGNTSCTNTGEGIYLNGNSAGTRIFGTLTSTGGNAGAFIHSNNGSVGGGNVTVTGTATLSTSGNPISVSSPATANVINFQGATTATSTGANVNGVVWNGGGNNATITFNSLSIVTNGTNGSGTALQATNGGTINVTNGTGTINNATQQSQAIVANGVTLNVNFATVNSSGGTNNDSLTNNVSLTNVNGTSNLGNGTLSGATGNSFDVANGGAISVTYAGSITHSAAATAAVSVAGGHTGTLTFNTGTVGTTGGNGLQFNNADGTYNFNGTVTMNGGDAGVDIINGSAGTFNFASTASIVSPTGSAFVVNSAAAPTVTYAGTITQNNGARIVDIQATTGGSATFTGTITGGASSQGIHIGDTTAVNGNVSFTTLNLGTSGSRMTNQAVTIANGGTGVTYALGTIAIFTTGAQGISASNFDGNLNITTGIVDSTSGRAINIDGPGGLTNLGVSLTKVSSTNSTNGINISDTSGSFTVTGNGGTCATSGTPNASCTGGAITGMTVGVLLNNATNISLDRLYINSTTSSGIAGASSTTGSRVNNFTLTNSRIDTTGTSATADIANSAIYFADQGDASEQNLTGAVNITGNNLTNMYWAGITIANYSGTISNANIATNTIVSPTTTGTSKGSGIQLITLAQNSSTTANITQAFINGNTVTNFPSDAGIMVQCNNTSEGGTATICGAGGVNVIAITSNIISGQSSANKIGTQGILFNVNGAGTGNFNVSNNQVSHTAGNSISHNVFGDAVVTSITGNNTVVSNNILGNSAIAGGIGETGGFTSDLATLSWKLEGNNTSAHDGSGIRALAGVDDTDGALNVTIRNNTVATPVSNTQGIRVAHNGNANSDATICLDIGQAGAPGNNTSSGPGAFMGIGLRKNGTDVFGIEGLPGGSTATPNVEAYVNGQNPSGGGTLLVSATTGFTSCTSALARPTGETSEVGGPVNPEDPNDPQLHVKLDGAYVPQMTMNIIDGPQDDPFVDPRAGEPELGANASLITESTELGGSAVASIPSRGSLGEGGGELTFSQVLNARPDGSDTQSIFATLFGMISPTAHAQEIVQGRRPEAGETVTVNGSGSGFTLPAGASVTITYDAQIAAVGVISPNTFSISNDGTISGNNFSNVPTDGDAGTGGAQPTVTKLIQPENVTKAFNPTSNFFGAPTTLTFTVKNDNPAGTGANATAITFTDPFPANMTVANPADASTTCVGGTLTDDANGALASGDTGIKLAGATLNAVSQCTVTVKVITSQSGSFPNATLPISSLQGAVGLPSNTATLTVSVLTSSGVSVSGRVLTADGRGVTNATVTLMDGAGQARKVTTGRGGAFEFVDVPTGSTYTLGVTSQRFTFDTQVIAVTDQVSGLTLTARPR